MKQKNAPFLKLSPLEQDVLKCLWDREEMYVREMYNCLKGKRKVALTSIAVILDRLHQKGLVQRSVETSRGGFRYLYSAAKTQVEFERHMVENAVNGIINRFGKTALSYFNERFAK
jgi:predicted transcriptional regulator